MTTESEPRLNTAVENDTEHGGAGNHVVPAVAGVVSGNAPFTNGGHAVERDQKFRSGRSQSNGRSKRDSSKEIEMFFDLAIAELSALRTRAEADAINRAVDLILE